MLRSESSSRMWIDAVRGLFAVGHVYSKLISPTGDRSAPLLLGITSYCALADSLSELHGSGRTCEIRHAREELEELLRASRTVLY